MDENYLDDLLKGVSTDNQKKNSFDKTIDKDSGVNIDFEDLDDISLDELELLIYKNVVTDSKILEVYDVLEYCKSKNIKMYIFILLKIWFTVMCS